MPRFMSGLFNWFSRLNTVSATETAETNVTLLATTTTQSAQDSRGDVVSVASSPTGILNPTAITPMALERVAEPAIPLLPLSSSPVDRSDSVVNPSPTTSVASSGLTSTASATNSLSHIEDPIRGSSPSPSLSLPRTGMPTSPTSPIARTSVRSEHIHSPVVPASPVSLAGADIPSPSTDIPDVRDNQELSAQTTQITQTNRAQLLSLYKLGPFILIGIAGVGVCAFVSHKSGLLQNLKNSIASASKLLIFNSIFSTNQSQLVDAATDTISDTVGTAVSAVTDITSKL